jgi:hypothetical protein
MNKDKKLRKGKENKVYIPYCANSRDILNNKYSSSSIFNFGPTMTPG